MQSLWWTEHFTNRGVTSYCFCAKGSPLEKKCRERGVKYISLKPGTYFSLSSSLEIRRALQKVECSHIISHHLKDLWLLVPALWWTQKPKIIGYARMFLKKHTKKDVLHTYLYSHLEKMIHISKNQKKGLVHCLPIDSNRYEFIPNGVDIEKFNPKNRSLLFRKTMGLKQDDVAIGIVGRIDQQKGQAELIEAFQRVRGQVSVKTKLIIVGEPTQGESELYTEELRRKTQEDKESILWLGYREDIPEIMASLDIFVLASYEETFGNVVLESMASGAATLVTQSGGAQEIIIEGESGLYIQPRDSESIFKVLKKLLEDVSLRQKLQFNGRKRAEEFYDIEKIKDQVLELTLAP